MKIIGLLGGFALLAFCIRGCATCEDGRTNSAFGYGFGAVVAAVVVIGLLSEGKAFRDNGDEDEDSEDIEED